MKGLHRSSPSYYGVCHNFLATTSNANKSKLDKVQNVALRAIVGAMKTTLIKEMEKRADLEPLEL